MYPDVVIVDGDEWQGLYVDGVLKCEDHRLRVDEVLDALGINVTVQPTWHDDVLPDKLEDLKD
jgi:hypothetical protein